MKDILEKKGNSIIQHGKYNDRIYVLKSDEKNYNDFIIFLEKLAAEKKYGKIFVKINEDYKNFFIKNSYFQEAFIPSFYKNKKGVCFVSKFLSKERQNFRDKNEIFKVTQFVLEKSGEAKQIILSSKYKIKKMAKEDIFLMVEIYKQVFESYPFPIFNSEYILETMQSHIDYYGVYYNQKLIALSSCEMDIENKNAEMTDFATVLEHRGNNLSFHLLVTMEKEAFKKGIKTFYTIARANSIGMNMAFAKNGYEFAGTLVNNSNIGGKIETMNVWYKNMSGKQ